MSGFTALVDRIVASNSVVTASNSVVTASNSVVTSLKWTPGVGTVLLLFSLILYKTDIIP